MTGGRAVVFGKLPRHGDFIARGLDAPARDAWDAWLSAAVEQARDDLGETFAAGHEIAAPWRFVCGPGPFGPGWRAGALAGSIDSAGRRFVIMGAADGLDGRHAAEFGDGLAEAIEAMIYRALEEGWDADALVEAIQSQIRSAETAGGDPPAARTARERWWTLDGESVEPASFDHAPRQLFGDPAFAAVRAAR